MNSPFCKTLCQILCKKHYSRGKVVYLLYFTDPPHAHMDIHSVSTTEHDLKILSINEKCFFIKMNQSTNTQTLLTYKNDPTSKYIIISSQSILRNAHACTCDYFNTPILKYSGLRFRRLRLLPSPKKSECVVVVVVVVVAIHLTGKTLLRKLFSSLPC